MNSVNLVGRLVAEPELKYTSNSNTAVCSFRIAVNRKFKGADGKYEVDFIDCVAWKKTAEYITSYGGKGRLVAVVGNIQTRVWVGGNGVKKRAVEVVADSIQVLEKKTEASEKSIDSFSSEIPDVFMDDLGYDSFEDGGDVFSGI